MCLQKCIIFPLTVVGRSVGVSGNTVKIWTDSLLKLISSNYFFLQFIWNEEDKKIHHDSFSVQ